MCVCVSPPYNVNNHFAGRLTSCCRGVLAMIGRAQRALEETLAEYRRRCPTACSTVSRTRRGRPDVDRIGAARAAGQRPVGAETVLVRMRHTYGVRLAAERAKPDAEPRIEGEDGVFVRIAIGGACCCCSCCGGCGGAAAADCGASA